MEMGSTGIEVEVVVVENIELDRAEYAGEAGRLNVVQVELGLSGMGRSFPGPNGMKETGRGNASNLMDVWLTSNDRWKADYLPKTE